MGREQREQPEAPLRSQHLSRLSPLEARCCRQVCVARLGNHLLQRLSLSWAAAASHPQTGWLRTHGLPGHDFTCTDSCALIHPQTPHRYAKRSLGHLGGGRTGCRYRSLSTFFDFEKYLLILHIFFLHVSLILDSFKIYLFYFYVF